MTRLASRHLPATRGDDWREQAACRAIPNPNTFFPHSGESVYAKSICHACPVETTCLNWALTQGPYLKGIFGGTSENGRRQIHRERGTISDNPGYPTTTRSNAVALWTQHRASYANDTSAARAIAKLLGIDSGSTVLTWMRTAGVASPLKTRQRTAAERTAAIADYERVRGDYRTETAARDAVALLHGVASSALRGWLTEAGVIKPKPRQPRNDQRRKPAEPA